MDYYYEDNFLIFKFKARLHERVILYNKNYNMHIKAKHHYMSMKKIEEILENPDFVYKSSRNSLNYYYEKHFGDAIYRVVIETYKRHVKKVVTAYRVDNSEKYTKKHVYCVYDRKTFIEYEDIEKQLENDIDYFYEMFNIAK